MNGITIDTLKERLASLPPIMGKEEYFNSAVLVPLIKNGEEFHLLFEKRAKEIRQGGEICFPGGEVDYDNDKTTVDTAVRETCEELGIGEEKIRVIGLMGTHLAPMGVTIDPVVAVLDIKGLDELKIDTAEVERVFTMPLSFFVQNEPEKYYVRLEVHPNEIDKDGNKITTLPVDELRLPRRYSQPWGGRKRSVLVYKNTDEVIWGITAKLIYEFVKLFK